MPSRSLAPLGMLSVATNPPEVPNDWIATDGSQRAALSAATVISRTPRRWRGFISRQPPNCSHGRARPVVTGRPTVAVAGGDARVAKTRRPMSGARLAWTCPGLILVISYVLLVRYSPELSMHDQWWTAPRAISRERPATLEAGLLPVALGPAEIVVAVLAAEILLVAVFGVADYPRGRTGWFSPLGFELLTALGSGAAPAAGSGSGRHPRWARIRGPR